MQEILVGHCNDARFVLSYKITCHARSQEEDGPDSRPDVSYGHNIVEPLGKSHAQGWWSSKWRTILWHHFCIPVWQSTPLPWLSLEVEPLWSIRGV